MSKVSFLEFCLHKDTKKNWD